MKWIRTAFIAHLLVGIACLAGVFVLNQAYWAAVLAVALGIYWYSTQATKHYGSETAMLLIALLAVAAGFYEFDNFYTFPPVMALLVAVPLMGAWDLSFFLRRLNSVQKIANERNLGRIHLGRLFMVEGAGLVLGMVALLVRLDVPFGLLLVLIYAAVLGVSQVVLYVRKQME